MITSTVTPSQVAEQAYRDGKLALTPEEAAKAISVTRTKIFALLASGAIRSIRVGKYRRIPVPEIVAWLQRELEAQCA